MTDSNISFSDVEEGDEGQGPDFLALELSKHISWGRISSSNY